MFGRCVGLDKKLGRALNADFWALFVVLFGFAGARPPVHMAVEREPFVISAVLVWGGAICRL